MVVIVPSPYTRQHTGHASCYGKVADIFRSTSAFDAAINCCLTHLSFDPPAPESRLKVAEVDKAGQAITLIADTARLSMIEEGAVDAVPVFSGVAGDAT